MKISLRFFPMNRNKSGSGGSNVFSGSFVLLEGDRAKEADTVEDGRSACGEVPDPSAPGDAQTDPICSTMACVAA
jgi:hypothetical protein